jgi:hypothetical protein
MTRRATALTLLLAALAAAGCGGGGASAGDFEGDERQVVETIDRLAAAGRERDAARVCSEVLAATVVRELGGEGGCNRAVDEAFDRADTFQLAVRSVRVDGDAARARVDAGRDEDRQELVELVREGDGWRVSRLAGTR